MNKSERKLPFVSIVIPMLNEIGAIDRCINSILNQDYDKSLIEIVVVDGGSTDGSREKVLELSATHSKIRLFDNPKRKTPISLNVGIKNSGGDVVIILGAHTVIKDDFVSQNIHFMALKNVKCAGGTQINVGDTYTQKAIGYAMGHPFGLASAPYRFVKSEKFVDTVVYAAYKKELFDEVGYFDEELFISEDAELNWRIRQAGHKIFYTPKIISYYYPRNTLKKLIIQLFRYGILRVNVIKKHFDAIKLVHLISPLFVLTSVFTGIFGFIWPAFFKILTGLRLIYLFFVLGSSLSISIKKGFKYLVSLPIIFISIHISWGIGFLVGIFKSDT